MTHRFAKSAAVFALAALCSFAHAQGQVLETEVLQSDDADAPQGLEAPGRVGRVSLVEGKVTIGGTAGESSDEALLNWPVASGNLVTTAPGARAELRIGSTAIRLDGDSSLDITELDDDSLRLRLHYGSASVRVTDPEVASNFELRTVQARVLLRQPGRLRIDAELTPETSVVSVFEGEAQVDAAGASLTLRTGRSLEVRDDDVRTLQAQRDPFDDWSARRDTAGDGVHARRYVGTEMTGYEELDRHGSWSVDAEYGNLWTPAVAADWVPYRDGRWSWIAPWGWTWVDNAPWGYAPFHYGRWVQVRQRWAWAPGRHERRPVWAPALVGWIGGKDWRAGFHGGQQPATGWYPLGPRERFVPGYRLSHERLRRLNDFGWGNNRKERDRKDGRPDFGRAGLTVVPHAHFSGGAPVLVTNLPRAGATPLPPTFGAAPPRPAWRDHTLRPPVQIIRPQRERDSWERDRDRFDRDRFDGDRFDGDRFNRERAERERMRRERNDRFERERFERERLDRNDGRSIIGITPGQVFQPGRITTAPQTGVVTSPAVQPAWQRPDRDGDRDRNQERWRDRERHDGGNRGGDRDGNRGGRGEDRPRPVVVAPPQATPPARVAPPQAAPVNRPKVSMPWMRGNGDAQQER